MIVAQAIALELVQSAAHDDWNGSALADMCGNVTSQLYIFAPVYVCTVERQSRALCVCPAAGSCSSRQTGRTLSTTHP